MKLSRQGSSISHIIFVDDIVIFLYANFSKAIQLCEVFQTYENWFGQKVNVEKSRIFFSKNTSRDTRKCIMKALQVDRLRPNINYLAIPLFLSASKVRDFQVFN